MNIVCIFPVFFPSRAEQKFQEPSNLFTFKFNSDIGKSTENTMLNITSWILISNVTNKSFIEVCALSVLLLWCRIQKKFFQLFLLYILCFNKSFPLWWLLGLLIAMKRSDSLFIVVAKSIFQMAMARTFLDAINILA